MTKFTKSLLTAAVVGALALPSLASAAALNYDGSKQITFAKDLIVNDGTTILVPADLTLRATIDDAARIATVASDKVTVKVTLTNGAKFDATADAPTLVAGFLIGADLGGAAAGTPIVVVGVPYYSATGQELNFSFTAPGAGVVGLATDFAVKLNSMQVTNLVEGLFDGSAISAQITAQNSVGQQILAAKAVIARSVWGLDIGSTLTTTPALTIDVANGDLAGDVFGRKTRFAPTGAVGGAAIAGNPLNTLFSPGSIDIDIAQALETDGATLSYVNNFDAVALTPEYNVVSTAVFTINVNGSDLTAFAGGDIYLDSSVACNGATPIVGTVTGGTAKFSAPATNPLFANVTNAPPSATSLFVCLIADDADEMVPQDLSADVSVDYLLNTQRVNPPLVTVPLSPLLLNGTTIIFQNVNPAGNMTAESFLRLTNNNDYLCPVSIDAKDDAGLHTKPLTYTMAAHTSKQLNSQTLENGGQGFGGSWGDGTGKWYVRVTAECSNFKASALNRHQDGTVTDLTPAKWVGNEWLTPAAKLIP